MGANSPPSIESDEELDLAFARLRAIWDAPEGSPEGGEWEALAAAIEAYEDGRFVCR